MLDKEKLLNHLDTKTRQSIQKIMTFDAVTSTNDLLLTSMSQKAECLAYFAECQTKGRGSRDRTWISPQNGNIYLSFSWVFDQSLAELSGFSLVVALVICEAIESLTPDATLKIKWPNDIYCNNKKLAGILIESQPIDRKNTILVIGIGINLKTQHLDALIDQPWVSLEQVTSHPIDREALAAEILNNLTRHCSQFKTLGFPALLPDIQARDIFWNQPVSIKTGGSTLLGKGAGIQTNGTLNIALENGLKKNMVSNQASIRLLTQ